MGADGYRTNNKKLPDAHKDREQRFRSETYEHQNHRKSKALTKKQKFFLGAPLKSSTFPPSLAFVRSKKVLMSFNRSLEDKGVHALPYPGL